MELGPGRGTLAKDMLRVAAQFPAFEKALTLHLVETSDALRAVQRRTINATMHQDYGVKAAGNAAGNAEGNAEGNAGSANANNTARGTLPGGQTVEWHYTTSTLPEGAGAGPLFAVVQELFDALLVH